MTENLPQVQSTNHSLPSAQEFQMLQIIAKNAVDSGFYAGIGQQAKIFMILLTARELGIGPMFALNSGLDNIQGSVEMKPVLMNALIRKRGHSITIEHSDDKKCVLVGKRLDGDTLREEYLIEEAIKAKLAHKDNWQKWPKDMLYARCMSRLGRKLFADVLGNVYADGEIKEIREIEKLPQADFEVKPSIPVLNQENKHDFPKNDTNLEQESEQVISGIQLNELMSNFVMTTKDFQENSTKFVKKEWNIDKWEDLPVIHYEKVMKWVAANLKAQTEGAIK